MYNDSFDIYLFCMISNVTETFTPMTPHRIELKPWARRNCVFLVITHRLIWCNMTYLGLSSGQAIWPDQRSNFWLIFLGQNAYVLIRVNMRNAMVFRLFLSSKIIRKNVNRSKKQQFFFNFACHGEVKMWSKVVKSGMVGFKFQNIPNLPFIFAGKLHSN